MFRLSLQRCLNLASPLSQSRLASTTTDATTTDEVDKLFSKIQIEVRGHEKAVLLSYTTFLKV